MKRTIVVLVAAVVAAAPARADLCSDVKAVVAAGPKLYERFKGAETGHHTDLGDDDNTYLSTLTLPGAKFCTIDRFTDLMKQPAAIFDCYFPTNSAFSDSSAQLDEGTLDPNDLRIFDSFNACYSGALRRNLQPNSRPDQHYFEARLGNGTALNFSLMQNDHGARVPNSGEAVPVYFQFETGVEAQ